MIVMIIVSDVCIVDTYSQLIETQHECMFTSSPHITALPLNRGLV